MPGADIDAAYDSLRTIVGERQTAVMGALDDFNRAADAAEALDASTELVRLRVVTADRLNRLECK